MNTVIATYSWQLCNNCQVLGRVCHHCPAIYSARVLQVSDRVCHHCPAIYSASVLQVSDRVCHHSPAIYSARVLQVTMLGVYYRYVMYNLPSHLPMRYATVTSRAINCYVRCLQWVCYPIMIYNSTSMAITKLQAGAWTSSITSLLATCVLTPKCSPWLWSLALNSYDQYSAITKNMNNQRTTSPL